MTRHDAARRAELWEELTRTADAVRAPREANRDDADDARSVRRALAWSAYAAVLGAVTVAALHASASATPVHADGSADSALFSLTNQDRASNGVRSMSFSGTLSTIGEGGRYTGCGFAVSGRSVDMIQRNYFAHPILGCGQYVFSIMQAYGVHYMSAGENIGWNTYGSSGEAASQINSAFMNSSEHRSNILNGNYTSMGVGSDNSGGSPWSGGGGGSFTGVWMFSEEFAQLRSAPPPPPPPPPPPRPKPRPTGGTAPSRNSPAPPPPAQGPATSTAPAPAVPTPTATPLPTLPPLPTGPVLPSLTLPPLTPEPGGLLFNSVESVLETYLID